MNKIKKFLSNNKIELQVLTYGIMMFSAGIYLGKRFEGDKWDEQLTWLGDTGFNINKIVGDNKYIVSVLKEQIK